MEYFYGHIMIFISGVALSALYFWMNNKSDRLNRNALLEELQDHRKMLKQHALDLEKTDTNFKMLFEERKQVRSVEIPEKVKLLFEKFEIQQSQIMELKGEISQLNPVKKVYIKHVYEETKRKRVSQ